MKKISGILLSLLLIVTMLAGCSAKSSAPEPVSTNDAMISSAYPIDTTVELHTDKQAAFLSRSTYSTIGYANGKKNNSAPKPVEFMWDCNAADGTQYVLRISENADMSDAVTYTTATESLAVYNLKIATDYYWTVSADGNTSGVFAFTTSDIPPRNINVDGITNVRDLGGRMTKNGTRTKQGLIYRCGRLNESSAETPNIEITEAGKRTMLDELGIKSEIDVRKADGETGAITSSPLGDSVTYFHCPMGWEDNMFLNNHDELLKIFEILSKQENYPVIFHCNIGTDRTGMIAFLVNALLGVPEEELFKDYVFSNFGNIGGTRQISQLKDSGYYKAVSETQGNTLSEKTYNCLVEFGVPNEQLDSIISILSEEQ